MKPFVSPGCAARSTGTSVPPRRTLVRVQTPIGPDAPSASFGSSMMIEKMSASRNVSVPVNW